MEIEISVVIDCPDWTTGDGIRELIQNAIEADAKGCLSRINYDKDNRILKIKSEGSTLPLENLMIGHSPRRNVVGDGIRFACMSLLKCGQSIKIKNGDQVWTPILRASKNIPNQEVLVIHVEQIPVKSQDFEIFIANLNDLDWQRVKANFLIFTPRQKYFSYETPFGYILEGADDDGFAGKIYINGLLLEVITDETYRFGYNVHPGWLRVDRERGMADRTSLKKVTSEMWAYLSESTEHFKSIEKLLMNDAMDLGGSEFALPSDLKDRIYRNFIKYHGKNAYPVVNSEEFSEVSLIGKNPVMSGKTYTKIIRSRLGDMSTLRRDFQRGVKAIFPLNNLSQMERDNFNRAKRLLAEVVDVPMIKICEFSSKDTQSLYAAETITIFISREVLKNFQETLRLLVREYCRKWGSNDSLYESELETVWSGLYLRLMNGVAVNEDVDLRQSGEERN